MMDCVWAGTHSAWSALAMWCPPLTTDLFVLVLDYRIAGKRGGGGNSEFCYNKQQRTYKVTNETGLHGGNY